MEDGMKVQYISDQYSRRRDCGKYGEAIIRDKRK